MTETEHVAAAVPQTSASSPPDPSLPFEVGGADDVPPMWFISPEGFHALPIAASAEERAEGAAEFVREMFPEGETELWTAAAPYYAAVAGMMTSAGLAYSAMGVFAIEEGVAHCSFTVAAIESDHSDPEVAAQGIRAILNNDPLNDVQWIDLPCGPAVACISMREITVDGSMTATGEDTVLGTAQLQVHVPFRTGPYTAIFTLDTAAIDYWVEFCDMVSAVLRTVSFSDVPLVASSPEAADAEA